VAQHEQLLRRAYEAFVYEIRDGAVVRMEIVGT
jgi:hypothetical protein